MKEAVKYAVVLGVICIAASALLAGVHQATQGRIDAQAEQERLTSFREILPDAEYFDEVSAGKDLKYYRALNKNRKIEGVLFIAQAKGYSSRIDTLVAMDQAGNIKAIKVLSQTETPGLGSQVAEADFTGRFSAKTVAGLNDVQAITGATISSVAVINSVKQAAEKILEAVNKNPRDEL